MITYSLITCYDQQETKHIKTEDVYKSDSTLITIKDIFEHSLREGCDTHLPLRSSDLEPYKPTEAAVELHTKTQLTELFHQLEENYTDLKNGKSYSHPELNNYLLTSFIEQSVLQLNRLLKTQNIKILLTEAKNKVPEDIKLLIDKNNLDNLIKFKKTLDNDPNKKIFLACSLLTTLKALDSVPDDFFNLSNLINQLISARTNDQMANHKRIKIITGFLFSHVPKMRASKYYPKEIILALNPDKSENLEKRIKTFETQIKFCAKYRVFTFKLCLLALKGKKVIVKKQQTETQNSSYPQNEETSLRRSGEKIQLNPYQEGHIACIPGFVDAPKDHLVACDPNAANKKAEEIARLMVQGTDIQKIMADYFQSKGSDDTCIQIEDLILLKNQIRKFKQSYKQKKLNPLAGLGLNVNNLKKMITGCNPSDQDNMKNKLYEIFERFGYTIDDKMINKGLFGITDVCNILLSDDCESLTFNNNRHKLLTREAAQLIIQIDGSDTKDEDNTIYTEFLVELILKHFDFKDNSQSAETIVEKNVSTVPLNSILGILLGQTVCIPGEINQGIDKHVYDKTHDGIVPTLLEKFSFVNTSSEEDFELKFNKYVEKYINKIQQALMNYKDSQKTDSPYNTLKTYIENQQRKITKRYLVNTLNDEEFDKKILGRVFDASTSDEVIQALVRPIIQFKKCAVCTGSGD